MCIEGGQFTVKTLSVFVTIKAFCMSHVNSGLVAIITLSFLASSSTATTTGNRFINVTESLNFTNADIYCLQHYGTHLASFNTKSEIDQASSICKEMKANCWIGLNEIENRNEWVYISGVAYNESVVDWDHNEPNGVDGQENCVEIAYGKGSKWNDVACSTMKPFICDYGTRSPTSQTLSPTTSEPTLPTASTTLAPTSKPSLQPTSAPIYGCLTSQSIIHETYNDINIVDNSVEIYLQIATAVCTSSTNFTCEILTIGDNNDTNFLTLFMETLTKEYYIEIYDQTLSGQIKRIRQIETILTRNGAYRSGANFSRNFWKSSIQRIISNTALPYNLHLYFQIF